ncbi:MAG: geranylgeranylglyceryl/heptaprenylglyceryl phosphate synthase [candidate division WOR-3 bacterium]|nr:geranylgeranylglyceryl/heptaprenylglyceryl phosphate synthase [candidate division WOR-3 bacterium]
MRHYRIWQRLNDSKPGIIALLDPDRIPDKDVYKIAHFVSECGTKAILIGTSLLKKEDFDGFVLRVKKAASCPVILFPGGSQQISRYADGIFFLSLLSGRNPEFLIGEHVKSVFLIKSYGLEVIPVGYILISSGNYTAVEYISNTRPIPRNKPEIAVAHALAGEYLGMEAIYLEAGSGAEAPVPEKVVKEVKKNLSIPLIVGGGIRKEKDARKLFDAGADFLVLGSIIESSPAKFKKIIQFVQS